MSAPPAAAGAAAPGAESLAALADQCVKCGLCLPHCPTYRVAREEGESPRGRVAFARHLAEGGDLSPRMRTQLDDCLSCGSCEVVCPSHVRYLSLIDGVRARIGTRAEPRWRGAVRRLATQGGGELRTLLRLGRAAEALGFARLADAVFPVAARLARVAGASGPLRSGPVGFTPAQGERRGSVALFRGCIASVTDADTQLATVDVLARIGYDVHAPGPLCCGALARHAGDVDGAAEQARDAAAKLQGLDVERVVGTASGCQRDLVDRVLVDAGLRGTEILTLLDADPAFAALPLRPLPRRVAWLVPCTESPAVAAAALRVLARIPQLEVLALPVQPRCCGAAGLYFADHAPIAEPLRAERAAQVRALGVDGVLTTNVGCRMYLRTDRGGPPFAVIHPITLVAEALAST